MSGLFSRGYDEVKKAKERQEENSGFELFDFYVADDGEEAPFMFLTEEPVNWDSHTLKTNRGYKTVVCTGEDCKHCAEGDRPRFVGSYLVVDLRPYTYEKDGEEVTKEYQVKLYTQGTRVLSQLDRLSDKYGLRDKIWNLVRIGKGKSTTYTFERDEDQELDSDQIKEILPEFLEDDYDGTIESLYKIVEEQIKMKIPKGSAKVKSETSEEDMKNKLVGTDDKKEEKKKKSKASFLKSGKKKKEEKSEKKSTKKKSKAKSLFKTK